MFLIDVDRLALPRRTQDVILEHIFENTFQYLFFKIMIIGRHMDMEVNM